MHERSFRSCTDGSVAAVSYLPRIVDAELDELMPGLPAIALEGAKGVGKTVTATRRASRVVALDDPSTREVVAADPHILEATTGTILLDEWQLHPPIWDHVRRQVDAGAAPGRYLLAGSSIPSPGPAHSGAGRIVSVRMRPLSLAERGLITPTVSLLELLSGTQGPVGGTCPLRLADYVTEIVASGLPAIRGLPPRLRRAQLDGYLSRVVDRDFPELGHAVRRPASLRAWLAAYAAASATTTSYNTLLDAATAGVTDKPAKSTTIAYRDVLERLFLLDPVPGWVPQHNHLGRLMQAPKHHLADPALAARLLNVDADALLSGLGGDTPVPRDGSLVGHLFESLVTLSMRTYAQAAEARVHHLRNEGGRREVDLIVEGPAARILAVEVKLSPAPTQASVAHLQWLRDRLGDNLLDALVITTGEHAYRRPDGIAVVPAALLGP